MPENAEYQLLQMDVGLGMVSFIKVTVNYFPQNIEYLMYIELFL